nr:immunoglobulin light chain junction region [Macaca mulatta]MOW04013.1 immunoglobulin light chain junction region [Macaca mulatta]MOW04036.1 immunoglobulin light chain junction region [Macaca mulatta]MOW04200.1 immunoglobulin light chain junction region [Macaca mulatta]MOW04201.1 immunoglobulin light chain junction region [Macaca mulatta]
DYYCSSHPSSNTFVLF